MHLLEGLNQPQKEAVKTASGPLLILAGAGSGKTKALTHRIAYLIAEKQILPSHILAVTFTNKAAREMRERLHALIGGGREFGRDFMPWMGTFHGICVRLLKIDGSTAGITRNFVIYDEDDRRALIKQAMKQHHLSERDIKASTVSGVISKAKNDMQLPEDLAADANYPQQKTISKLYASYEDLRRQAGALDFDDLLIETVRLLRDYPDVAKKWRQQFKHILVDEYQDTNAAQYQLVKLLANEDQNICVVGDDWQSIYSWRGADFTNILNFEKDFPGAKIIKLEQNYRSTGNILDAAHSVITKNTQRTDKKLWTATGAGYPVQVHGVYDDAEEAQLVADRIGSQVAIEARRFDDFAVLYRTNAQSYTLERALLQRRVPYQIVGGVRFYDRKEIKDIVAYLRLLYQPNDRMSFTRIVNVPARGIGVVSLEKFFAYQSGSGQDIIASLKKADSIVTGKARQGIARLANTLGNLRDMAESLSPAALIEEVLKAIHYHEYLQDGTPQAEDREANIGALLSDAQLYQTLPDFLEEVALMSSVDTETEREKVTLMTLHAAKGLEFPVVFMVGMEEGILPHVRVFEGGPGELEEERRLCYVGMTRAREELHLSYAYSRLQYGQRAYNPISRFISDMGDQVAIASPEPRVFNVDDEPFYSDEPFEVGERVRSAVFGAGTVIDVDGMAATIEFDSGQTKKLNVEYARLEKLL